MRAVHPRVRGERVTRCRHPSGRAGSSPRARGTGLQPRRHPAHGRFIPACAGNGWIARTHPTPQAVHPRVRGERRWRRRCARSRRGSSPRARGTERAHLLDVPPCRFIPACAGNGSADFSLTRLLRVHPRVRGERALSPGVQSSSGGSSPRARGTDTLAATVVVGDRFIPACAGNGGSSRIALDAGSVHPRVRGERAASRSSAVPVSGSSPRARGTGSRGQLDHRGLRFIPACAGNGPTSSY